jgi:hypothetical protein
MFYDARAEIIIDHNAAHREYKHKVVPIFKNTEPRHKINVIVI